MILRHFLGVILNNIYFILYLYKINLVREKSYMKKRILNLYNDHLLQLPKDYEILENTEIS